MPEPAARERLQPSLLDRLTDDERERATESRDRRVLSMRRLRECVLRDLTWLLNTSSLDQTEDLAGFPEVARSTLNYGLRDVAGTTISKAGLAELEREVKQAILRFEPRILARTLQVRAVAGEEMSRHALSFEIEGELWAEPVPLRMLLKTELDVETGEATVLDAGETG